MVSKIEQIIEEMEELIDNCKYATFSSTKILVDKEEIDELLHELKTHTPDEIMRCQKIISNKEAIIEDAHAKADALIKGAQEFSDQMVSEHEILQQAYTQAGEIVNQAKYQAQEIMSSATVQAENIQSSAIQYTDDSLANIQQILMASIQETQENNNNLIQNLSQILNVVNANRAELHPDEDELARNAAIAERAEAERLMAEAQNPGAVGADQAVQYAAPAEAVNEDPAPASAPAPAPVRSDSSIAAENSIQNTSGAAPAAGGNAAAAEAPAPSPKASGRTFKGGISKAILEAKE
ncbi:MAG: hypothetical protein K5668_11305 [Lachnospiraceae bacterium]|nr:hypothetical protein [Lachnospiraceae bacterium]